MNERQQGNILNKLFQHNLTTATLYLSLNIYEVGAQSV